MPPVLIHFQCPCCQIRLTVPESTLGISGPCPRCGATIQAPAIPPAKPPSSTSQSKIRRKPRTLSDNRKTYISTRHSTNDVELRRPIVAEHRKRYSHRNRTNKPSSVWTRLLVPALFAIAGAAIVFALLYRFYPSGPTQQLRKVTAPNTRTLPSQKEDTAPKPDPKTPTATAPATPIRDDPSPRPPGTSAASAIESGKVLDRFISATRLATRLELIDPPLSAEQIKGTVAAKRMPEVTSLTPAIPEYDALEQIENYPFRVTLSSGENTTTEYLILVRKRGDASPKVAIEPFLDLVGGRLKNFTATPVKGAHTFQVIIEPLPRCFEDTVPNPEKKITYKLLPCDIGPEIARSYVSRTSKLAEQLYLPESEIRFGSRPRATVVLEWNFDEDPDRPFIQLNEIESLNWNP